MSTFAFTHSELQSLPNELLVELLRVAGTSTPAPLPLDQRVDEWAARIAQWACSQPDGLDTSVPAIPEYVDIGELNSNDAVLRYFSTEAYMRWVGTEAVPFCVYRQLAACSEEDHQRDMHMVEPDFVRYQEVMEQRARVAAIRAGTRPAHTAENKTA